MSNPIEVRLRAELRAAREREAALVERLIVLQAANEGGYRADYDATGGPRFDPLDPVGVINGHPLEAPVDDIVTQALALHEQNGAL